MSISDVRDVPKIFVNNREIGYFIPPATFGYLYILESKQFYLIMFSVVTVVSVGVYVGSNVPSHEHQFDLPDRLESIFFFLFFSSILSGIILLIAEHTPVPDAIPIQEVAFIVLLFLNIGYISGITLASQYVLQE
jgi:hypothetical protein